MNNKLWIAIQWAGFLGLIIICCCFLAVAKFRIKAFKCNTHKRLSRYPKVSIILCVKGRHSNSLENFKRVLQAEYEGAIEFIFVAESEDDQACACAKEAIQQTVFKNPARNVKVEIAGLSFHNAQKFHNILKGISVADPDSEIITLIDDDVCTYPGFLDRMVEPLIDESKKYMVTASYEFCLPTPESTVSAHAMAIYRLHNLVSFTTEEPMLAWAGTFAFPHSLFKENKFNVVNHFFNGGYSDDTVISCLARENGYKVYHHPQLIFSNIPNEKMSFSWYYDFLVRQLFVLKIYTTKYNKFVARTTAYCTFLGVLVFALWTIPVIPAGIIEIIAASTGKVPLTLNTAIPVICLAFWMIDIQVIRLAEKVMTDVSNSVKPESERIEFRMSSLKIFLGAIMEILLIIPALIRCFIKDYVVWSKVKYTFKDGRVCKVERLNDNGTTTTLDFYTSRANAIKNLGLNTSN